MFIGRSVHRAQENLHNAKGGNEYNEIKLHQRVIIIYAQENQEKSTNITRVRLIQPLGRP